MVILLLTLSQAFVSLVSLSSGIELDSGKLEHTILDQILLYSPVDYQFVSLCLFVIGPAQPC